LKISFHLYSSWFLGGQILTLLCLANIWFDVSTAVTILRAGQLTAALPNVQFNFGLTGLGQAGIIASANKRQESSLPAPQIDTLATTSAWHPLAAQPVSWPWQPSSTSPSVSSWLRIGPASSVALRLACFHLPLWLTCLG
jgi:hypothetical protein